jgi:hypothetical protein
MNLRRTGAGDARKAGGIGTTFTGFSVKNLNFHSIRRLDSRLFKKAA